MHLECHWDNVCSLIERSLLLLMDGCTKFIVHKLILATNANENTNYHYWRCKSFIRFYLLIDRTNCCLRTKECRAIEQRAHNVSSYWLPFDAVSCRLVLHLQNSRMASEEDSNITMFEFSYEYCWNILLISYNVLCILWEILVSLVSVLNW